MILWYASPLCLDIITCWFLHKNTEILKYAPLNPLPKRSLLNVQSASNYDWYRMTPFTLGQALQIDCISRCISLKQFYPNASQNQMSNPRIRSTKYQPIFWQWSSCDICIILVLTTFLAFWLWSKLLLCVMWDYQNSSEIVLCLKGRWQGTKDCYHLIQR